MLLPRNSNKCIQRDVMICPVNCLMIHPHDGRKGLTAESQCCQALLTSQFLALPLPAWSGHGVHFVLDWLEDHTKLALQTGQWVPWWDRECEALEDPGQEKEELHLGQDLTQTHPDPSTKRQVTGWWDDQSCAFTVQKPTCRGRAQEWESTYTSITTSLQWNQHQCRYQCRLQGKGESLCKEKHP